MKSLSLSIKFILILGLALIPLHAAYGQSSGTSPQSGTYSQQPAAPVQPAPAHSGTLTQHGQPTPQRGTELRPSDGHSDTPTVADPRGMTGINPPVGPRQARWPWLLIGLAIGLFVGALAWRRPAVRTVVYEEERRDRAA
jgi:hypothetical protein